MACDLPAWIYTPWLHIDHGIKTQVSSWHLKQSSTIWASRPFHSDLLLLWVMNPHPKQTALLKCSLYPGFCHCSRGLPSLFLSFFPLTFQPPHQHHLEQTRKNESLGGACQRSETLWDSAPCWKCYEHQKIYVEMLFLLELSEDGGRGSEMDKKTRLDWVRTCPVSRKLRALPRAPVSPAFQRGLCKSLANVEITSGATQVTQKGGNWMTNQTGSAHLLLCAQSLSCIQFFETPWDYSPLGFSVHGIFLALIKESQPGQTRVLEQVAISSSRGPSWTRDQSSRLPRLWQLPVDSVLLSCLGSPLISSLSG